MDLTSKFTLNTSNYTNTLKMNDVISGNVPHTENVLYVPGIDKAAFMAALKALKENVSATVETTDEMIHTIDNGLAETNSNRFYRNGDAVKQVTNMNTLSSDMKGLMELFGQISEDRIAAAIDSYNSSLGALKRTTRKELLEDAAQEANGQKCKKTETSRAFYPNDGANHSYYNEEKNGTTKVVTKRYKSGVVSSDGKIEYITKVETYTWIQCSDNVSITEHRFREVGIDLPYSPSKIVDIDL